MTPQRLGRFEILSPIGGGGMGIVYKAHDPEDGRPVAIKVLPEAFSRRADFVERFKREARICMSLSHVSIPKIYDFGVEGGRYFLAMEWIDGRTLDKWIAENGSVADDKSWKDLFSKVCDGVDAAHRQGVLHRDLKAENIILTPDGGVRIMDFGLSKLAGEEQFTQTGQIIGTPQYTAPEQILSSGAVTAAADIWSLGVLGYQMAAGRLPFDADNMPAVLKKILDPACVPPPPGRINRKLSFRSDSIIRKCMQRDMAVRYGSVSGILRDLRGPAYIPVRIEESRARHGWMVLKSIGIGALNAIFNSRGLLRQNYRGRLAKSLAVSTERLNVNTASVTDLATIGQCGAELAGQIVLIRKMDGPVEQMDDLAMIPGMTDRKLSALKSVAYAAPDVSTAPMPRQDKIDINSAGLEELKSVYPQLHDAHHSADPWSDLKRLVEYRQTHGPFRRLEEVCRVQGFPRAGKKYWLVAKLARV